MQEPNSFAIDLRVLLQAMPGKHLVLLPDAPQFTVVAASEGFVTEGFAGKGVVMGESILTIYAGAAVAATSTLATQLHASLQYVLTHQTMHEIPALNLVHTIEEGSGTNHLLWRVCNKPVQDADGGIRFIVHTIEEVAAGAAALFKFQTEHRRLLDAQTLGKIGSFEWNMGEAGVDWSDELYRINGLEPQSEGITIERTNNWIHPDDREKVFALKEASFSQPGFYQTEHRIVLDDGTEKWVLHRFESLADKNAQVYRVQGTLQDISDRKKAEAEIIRLRDEVAKTATDRYYTLFDTMAEGLSVLELIYDGNGKPADMRWLEVNPAFEKITGLKNVSGRLTSDFVPTEQYWLDAYDKVVKTGGPLRFENYHAGIRQWYRTHTSRVGGPGSKVIANVFEDITEHKQLELQQQYLLKLADAIRSTSNLDAIEEVVTAAALAFFKADRCYYCAIEKGNAVIRCDTRSEGLGSVAGIYSLHQTLFFDVVMETRRVFVANDIQTSESVNGALVALLQQANIRAMVSVPLVKEGLVVGVFTLAQKEPRTWTDLELTTAIETAERIWIAAEATKAEKALRESEEKYRSVFENIDEAFTVQELVTDENDKIIDIIYREANSAFAQHTGIENVVGKKASELFPQLEQHWLDAMTQVYETGVPVRTEGHQADLNRWLTLQYSRVGGPGSKLISVVFRDVTERKQQELQQTFLLNLSDILRTETSSGAIADQALQLLYEHLSLDRCYIGILRLADDLGDFRHQVGNERVAPLPASVRLSDLPDPLQLAFNQTLVIKDVNTAKGLSDLDRRNLSALGMCAVVAASLRKGGNNPIWSIAAVSAQARNWTPVEVRLIEEVTERTGVAIERVNAEAALRESEGKFRKLFESIEEGFCTASRVPGTLIDFRFVAANAAFTRLTGIASPVGSTFRETVPQIKEEWMVRYDRAAETGSSESFTVDGLGKEFEVEVMPAGRPGEIAILFRDITERKQKEQQQAFLFTLSDSIRYLRDPLHIQHTVTKALAAHLDLNWCYYFEIGNDEDTVSTIAGYASHGAVELPPGARVSDFGTPLLPAYQEGKIVCYNDIDAEVNFTKADRKLWHSFNSRAFIAIPLIKVNRFVALLGLSRDAPKSWREDEVALAREVAERTWAAVERARIEEALQHSEEQLRNLNDALEQQVADRTKELQKNIAVLQQAEEIAGMGSWEYDTETGKFTWSEGMYRLLQLSTGTTVPPEVYIQLAHPDDEQKARRLVSNIRGGSANFGETVCLVVGGQKKVLRVQGYTNHDEQGMPLQVIGVDIDITAVQEAERTLGEQAHFIQSINKALPDILFVMNLETKKMLYINHSFEEVLGYANRDGAGSKFLDLVYEEDLPTVLAHLEHMRGAAEGNLYEVEYRLQAPDGSLHWFRDRNAVFRRDKAGRNLEKIGIAQDITHRRQAEQDLKESNINLQYANENLQQFASIASHDMQEPLRKLRMFASMLSKRYAGSLPQDGQELLAKMATATDRMRQLIKEVLDYSRLGQDAVDRVPTDLDVIVKNVLGDLEVLIEEKGAAIRYEKALPMIHAVPQQMNQLFYNLLTNALKFCREEAPPAIQITWRKLDAEEVKRNSNLKEHLPHIEVVLSDNGIGFEQQFADQIFQIFERLHPVDEYEGTGVGLALCKKIVENHLGHIYAQAEEGAGASFYILLPISNHIKR